MSPVAKVGQGAGEDLRLRPSDLFLNDPEVTRPKPSVHWTSWSLVHIVGIGHDVRSGPARERGQGERKREENDESEEALISRRGGCRACGVAQLQHYGGGAGPPEGGGSKCQVGHAERFALSASSVHGAVAKALASGSSRERSISILRSLRLSRPDRIVGSSQWRNHQPGIRRFNPYGVGGIHRHLAWCRTPVRGSMGLSACRCLDVRQRG